MTESFSNLLIEEEGINYKELVLETDNPSVSTVLAYKPGLVDISNAVVFVPNYNTIHEETFNWDNYKNCLIIQNYRVGCKSFVKDSNIFLFVKNVLRTVAKIISENYVNDPTIIDQMSMRYNNNPAKGNRLERYICRTFPHIGQNVLIGIEDQVIYKSEETNLIFPSVGGVTIGDNVIIGNNVIIYRGLTEDTVIDDGVIIPDNVIIHHDAHIRKSTELKSFNEYY